MELMEKKFTRPLTGMLICLTVMMLFVQLELFYIHAQGASLIDSLIDSTIGSAIFYPSVALPILQFILLQVIACILLIIWARFVAFAVAQYFSWSPSAAYRLGIGVWLSLWTAIFLCNHMFYPHSFFASWIDDYRFGEIISRITLAIAVTFIGIVSLIACYQRMNKRHGFILAIVIAVIAYQQPPATVPAGQTTQPNIIIIGLDSVRPDFINKASTPTVDAFLASGAVFAKTYTPFARTYPSWISILTGKNPKHHGARFNLAESPQVLQNEMLSRRLRDAGYATLFATDEARFSDIHTAYGFDQVVRPGRGLADFILGSLTDFPLTNLLVNMPGGQWLFPYNYANRAAYVTYQPENFLRKVNRALLARDSSKPLFLSIHLCLAHWPFTWASDGDTTDYLPAKYELSVEGVDTQLGQLLKMLKQDGLLEHSLVVLLSDHGTTMGLPDDRIVKKEKYVGDQVKLNLLSVSKLVSAPDFSWHSERDFTINTSYGQGTDVLSLKQYHSLLAFKGFGVDLPKRMVETTTSLMDVAPTILDFLQLPALASADGISLYPAIAQGSGLPERPIYIETGEMIDGMAIDNADVARIVHSAIRAYQVDRASGAVVMTNAGKEAGMYNKQYAVIFGGQMLAQYPPSYVGSMVTDAATGEAHVEAKVKPGYFVTANLHTGKWHFGADTRLKRQLQSFYDPQAIVPMVDLRKFR